MIKADLHLHTCYSHGRNTPWEMHVAASKAGLAIMGFSEHSPRPIGYDYIHEYREHLTRHLPRYAREVLELKEMAASRPGACQVLFGLEMDWIDGQMEFIRKAVTAYDYDYLIGSVHFLDAWGFDDGSAPWASASQEQCERWFERYFELWLQMIQSGLFQIAAHPDLIKIFAARQFHAWLARPRSQEIIRHCLIALRDAGMALEVSSAGLRKACREIYPAPAIMRMAKELNLPISLASDAHNTRDVAADFELLASFAHSFGFFRQTIYNHGEITTLPF